MSYLLISFDVVYQQVILSDGDLSTLANMKSNLELNHLNAEFEMAERNKNLSMVSLAAHWIFFFLLFIIPTCLLCLPYCMFLVFFFNPFYIIISSGLTLH